jgi:hypothetical protein
MPACVAMHNENLRDSSQFGAALDRTATLASRKAPRLRLVPKILRRSIRLGTQIRRWSDRRARSGPILGPSCRRPRNSTSYTSIGRRCRQPSLSRQTCRGQPRADRSAKRSNAIRGSPSQKLSVTPLVFRLSRFDAFSRFRCLKQMDRLLTADSEMKGDSIRADQVSSVRSTSRLIY